MVKVFADVDSLGAIHRAPSPGLGLGLHIAAEIIQRQQGPIWVESEEGKGVTFCFSLPIDRERAGTSHRLYADAE